MSSTPRTAAIDKPETVTVPTGRESVVPTTSSTAVMNRFRLSDKSTLFSPKIRIPTEAIIPNKMMDTPPITGAGIVRISAPNFPISPIRIATQAAIRSGYSPKTAYSIGEENLKKPELKTYIEQQLERIHNEKTADAQEVLEYLTAVMRGEHTEQTLQLIGEGVQKIADIDVSAKERIKAAELIGKRYGMFKDNVNVDLEPVVIVNDLTE